MLSKEWPGVQTAIFNNGSRMSASRVQSSQLTNTSATIPLIMSADLMTRTSASTPPKDGTQTAAPRHPRDSVIATMPLSGSGARFVALKVRLSSDTSATLLWKVEPT